MDEKFNALEEMLEKEHNKEILKPGYSRRKQHPEFYSH